MLNIFAAVAASLAVMAASAIGRQHPHRIALSRSPASAPSPACVRVFGVNSEAALKAAAEEINKAGGITLGDGAKAKLTIEFLDDRCNAEEGISVVRRIASTDAFVAVGPTCSNVAESLFGILQKKVGDASDTGLQFPIIADVAAKGGLAKISEWSFRNVPSEFEMYKSLFAWLKTQHPTLKTIYGGVEKDFAHSNATFGVMKAQAEANGFQVVGQSEWLLARHHFFDSDPRDEARQPRYRGDLGASVHDLRRAQGDGTAGREAKATDRPYQLVEHRDAAGLRQAGGRDHHPDQLRAGHTGGEEGGREVAKFGGSADLHSAAAYEIMFILKDVIEQQKIMAKPDTVAADRVKMRQGLAALKETDGPSRQGRTHVRSRGDQAVPLRPRQGRQLAGSLQASVLTVIEQCGSAAQAAVRRVPPHRRINIGRAMDVDLLDLIDTVQSVADGVLFGATYALLGIGFTLVFGVMHKINLSYAAASIGAAYASLLILAGVKAPPALVFLLAAAAAGSIGVHGLSRRLPVHPASESAGDPDVDGRPACC